MEIAFIIQWKEKIENKTDLTGRIKEMLDQVFKDVTNDSFSYTFDDKSSYSFKYDLSEKVEKAYLKIINNESDAKALSSIRDIISKNEHRKDFLIICSYDEASLSYCCRLMKPMGIFERHLRELMYLIITKAFGVDWVKKTIPKDIQDSIKEKTHGLSDEKITETALELLTFNEIIIYLFNERYINISPEIILENELSDEKLKTLSKEEIIAIISNNRKCSLWNNLFADIKGINKETIKNISGYRNDVMHHHTLSEESFKTISREVKKADKIITQAITDIESKIYTEEERKIVLSSIGYSLSEMLSKSLRNSFDYSNLGLSTSQLFGESLRNISDYSNLGLSVSESLKESLKNSFDYSNLGLSVSESLRESLRNISDYSNLGLSTSQLFGELLRNNSDEHNSDNEQDKDNTIS